MISGTYPHSASHERTLFLFDRKASRLNDLGRFYAMPELSRENRCDLHPRWRRDGLQVCVDSIHEHDRAMYVVDVSSVTANHSQ